MIYHHSGRLLDGSIVFQFLVLYIVAVETRKLLGMGVVLRGLLTGYQVA